MSDEHPPVSGTTNPTITNPTIVDALIPVATLAILIGSAIYLFGNNATGGPIEVALILSALVGAIVAIKNGHTWPGVMQAITAGISDAMEAIFILLAIGALIGTWAMSGTLATMIDYGSAILRPGYFYVASAIICAIIAATIGSSWTTAGTIGVALIAIAKLFGVSSAITAGAVVSGAYFGNNFSPLSDTTNLAAAIAKVNVFEHIKKMFWMIGPALALALILYAIMGVTAHSSTAADIASLRRAFESDFNINPLTLVPLVVVVVLALRKFPAFPTVMIGALTGGLVAILFQPHIVGLFAGDPRLGQASTLIRGMWLAMATGFHSNSGNAKLDGLLSIGGMSSMLTTIWIILTAMSFGAVMEASGMLQRLTDSILSIARTSGALVVATVLSCIGMNVFAGDQYLAVVLPGKMYRAEYERRNLAATNLSRAVAISGVATSALIAWNSCGAFLGATLGVSAFSFFPYAFFNLIAPIVCIVYGLTGFKLDRISPPQEVSPAEPLPQPVRTDIQGGAIA